MVAGHFGDISCGKCADQPDLKEAWQCEGGPDRYRIPIRPPFEIERCPMSYLDHSIERAFFLYGHYKNGRLPVSGGVLEQCRVGLEVFRLIDEYMELAERK